MQERTHVVGKDLDCQSHLIRGGFPLSILYRALSIAKKLSAQMISIQKKLGKEYAPIFSFHAHIPNS
jgi:hypothetical protein